MLKLTDYFRKITDSRVNAHYEDSLALLTFNDVWSLGLYDFRHLEELDIPAVYGLYV